MENEKDRDNSRLTDRGEERLPKKKRRESKGEEVRQSHVGVDVRHSHCAGSSLPHTYTTGQMDCVCACVCLHYLLSEHVHTEPAKFKNESFLPHFGFLFTLRQHF